MLAQINPMIEVVHHEQADEATECITVMGQDFKSLTYEAIANVPGYDEWLLGVDQRSAYEYHRSVLQVLQSGGVRGRWTLKSPHHAIALEYLTAVYPDARLVLLHRDPVVLTASVCSLITTLSSTFSDADHRPYIARHWPAMLDESIRRIEVFRAAHPEFPILDVQYADLVTDPSATVTSIYSACGDELDDLGAKAIADYVAAHPKGQFGAHRYDVAEFGLDAGELAERFAGVHRALRHPARVVGLTGVLGVRQAQLPAQVDGTAVQQLEVAAGEAQLAVGADDHRVVVDAEQLAAGAVGPPLELAHLPGRERTIGVHRRDTTVEDLLHAQAKVAATLAEAAGDVVAADDRGRARHRPHRIVGPGVGEQRGIVAQHGLGVAPHQVAHPIRHLHGADMIARGYVRLVEPRRSR